MRGKILGYNSWLELRVAEMAWRSPIVMLYFWLWKLRKLILQLCNRDMDGLCMMFGSFWRQKAKKRTSEMEI